ncbi:hypothetical protein F3Y22_tig00112123pilonHSYRG00003 [Hibiscus syriacus]|uniref:Apple domain-containing protein n=1 Tax=Hibiscus syriacus TaxID=106335 RepID=A0A6A2Y454_HIBSY|nr:hypothetical protein F3Y22_tig00112123pilonHSYRG00003 [Hibiscus syriacus]
MNMDACRSSCLGNCSCTAYAFVSGIGCMIWQEDLVDLHRFEQAGTLQFFYRVHNSELAEIAHLNMNSAAFHCIIQHKTSCMNFSDRLTPFLFISTVDGGRKISDTAITIITVLGACLLVVSICLLRRYKKKVKRLPVVSSIPCCKEDDVAVFNESKTKDFSADLSGPTNILLNGSQVNGPELTIVTFGSVAAATKNFSEANKLGKGGFGTVYKGELPGGQEIAVKRLSGTSGQGLEETFFLMNPSEHYSIGEPGSALSKALQEDYFTSIET